MKAGGAHDYAVAALGVATASASFVQVLNDILTCILLCLSIALALWRLSRQAKGDDDAPDEEQ